MLAIKYNPILSRHLPFNNADTAKGWLSIAAIFSRYWADYRQNNSVTLRQSKVVNDILNCRTGGFGYSISACDNCGHTEVFLNSCRNSHYLSCQGNKHMELVDSRLNDLLPVPYYHGVFTLKQTSWYLYIYHIFLFSHSWRLYYF